ncbi:MAG: hypothetical protein ACT4PG_12565 [Panacagrimonas sp.]
MSLVGTAALAGPSIPAAGISLAVLGPTLGAAPLPGTGIYSGGITNVAGLALALKNNDGAGHSLIGLKAKLGGIPTDVEAFPALPGLSGLSGLPISIGVLVPQ